MVGTTAAPHQTITEPKLGSKLQLILKQLQMRKGTTIERMSKATGLQPHSIRAALTNLRKRGYPVARTSRQDGKSVYALRVQ